MINVISKMTVFTYVLAVIVLALDIYFWRVYG
jgi:hypothetical protein